MKIVGYTFDADQYHPEHLIEVLIADGHASPAARDMNVESALDQIAEANAISRELEETFDGGDFPKVVFADQITDDDICGHCGEPLTEEV